MEYKIYLAIFLMTLHAAHALPYTARRPGGSEDQPWDDPPYFYEPDDPPLCKYRHKNNQRTCVKKGNCLC
ncbi:hypothetical protein O181_107091 [Austropuccinia psidii MF-1]|uniref:Uncharacterized protein n=1 Tax=Austropuccinia psidii MF-1 TaxID=1389203 RepID=A0A9Q3JS64_9BASI|nr:hypothetical protein [Austropuccinia psidii MF-1]